MRTKILFVVAILVTSVFLGPSLRGAPVEPQYGTRDRLLEGRRYQTLRALAHHLEATTRGALEGAADEAQRGPSSSEGRFLSSVRAFARGASDFQRMVDNYETSPFEVPAHVDDLTARAHQANDRIRSAGALESTYDDWDAMLDVLERMRLLLGGRDVEVPAAHVVTALSGARLQEFRQLAQDVETSATRSHERAKRDVRDYPQRGEQFLGELNYFAARSRDLDSRANAVRVDPQQIGPIVDRLLDEARQADRRMRDARVFTSVWDDSGRTITILHRMASLVRS
jgi:hypothetical protein